MSRVEVINRVFTSHLTAWLGLLVEQVLFSDYERGLITLSHSEVLRITLRSEGRGSELDFLLAGTFGSPSSRQKPRRVELSDVFDSKLLTNAVILEEFAFDLLVTP